MDKAVSPSDIPRRTSSARFSDPSSKPRTASRPILRPLSEDIWLGSNVPPKSNTHAKMSVPLPPLHNRPAPVSASAGEQEQRPPQRQQNETKGIGENLITSHADLRWPASKETIMLSPYTYMHNQPGKDVRSQLIAAFNAWLRVPAPALVVITKVVGMLHTSSLLVDDVEDSSILRRGVPVAHSIFGVAQTLNSANYVYFLAMKELHRLGNYNKAIDVFTEEMINLHRGQGMDLWWRDSLICPSEEEYLEMVSNKTGGLFRLAVKLMLAESEWGNEDRGELWTINSESSPDNESQDSAKTFYEAEDEGNGNGRRKQKGRDLIPLVNTIGLLFQILDDYRNLSSAVYTTNKGLAEDLTEGKFSFPIIHSIRTSADASPPSISSNRSSPSSSEKCTHNQDVLTNGVLINILRQKTTDPRVKQYAIRHMEEVTGSFAYTRNVLRQLTDRAVKLVDEVDEDQGPEGKELSKGIRVFLEKLKVDANDRGSAEPVK